MLDLTTRAIDFYELKWFDGEVLKIHRPSQALIINMMKLDTLPDEEQIKAMYDLLKQVLNNNKNGRKFSDEDIDNLSFEVVEMIMEDYLNTVFPNLGQ